MAFKQDQKLIVTFHQAGISRDYAVAVAHVALDGTPRCIATHVPTPYEYLTFHPRQYQDIRLGQDGVTAITNAPWQFSLNPLPSNVPRPF